MKRYITSFVTAILAVFLVSCTNFSHNTSPKEISIQGFAQKGQLVKGSQITAFALTDRGVATGDSYPANISDDLGSFALDISTEAPLLELRTEGYYFNEVTGSISEAPMYLEAIAPSESSNMNVNLLTTLVKPRIKHLLAEGMEYNEAVAKAQHELLLALGVEADLLQDFSSVDLMGSEEGDAALLAYACIIQQDRTTGEVVTLVQAVASELENEGQLSQNTVETIIANRAAVKPFAVARNIARFYTDKGIDQKTLSPFYKYIDDRYDSDFIIDTFEEPTTPSLAPDLNYYAVEASYDIISTSDFVVECDDEFVSIEKRHLLGDFYTVYIHVAENQGPEIRSTEVLFKSKSGNLLATREFSQGVNLQIVELQIGEGSRTALTIEEFNHPSFAPNDQVGVNDMVVEIDVQNPNLGIVKLPRSGSYFFSFPAGCIAKDGHIARVAVNIPAEITASTPIPYYAGLEEYAGFSIPNPAQVKLNPAVALLGFRPKGFDHVAYLTISGNGADDYVSGEFSYVPDKNSLAHFPNLNPEVKKGNGKSMKLSYQDSNGVFWATLPPIDFNSGLTLTLYNSGGEMIKSIKIENPLSLKAGALMTLTINNN